MLAIGVIGAGHLGKIHLSLLKNNPAFKIIGFYDIDGKVSARVQEETGVRHFGSADELIALCEAVDIVTPTGSHFDYACKTIRLGKHVFIEKPVTLNSNEARQLALLAREAGVIAQAGHVERFNPAFLAAEPFMVRPFYMDCQRMALFNPRGTDVSVVLDLMIHDIDLALRMARSNIKKISASGFPVLCDSEDVAEARIEFDNGCVANLRANRTALQNTRLLEVFQEKDYLQVDLLEKKVTRAEVTDKTAGNETIVARHRNKYMTAENLVVQPVNAIGREFEFFAEAIANKSVPAVSLDEAYQAMKVADEIITRIRKP